MEVRVSLERVRCLKRVHLEVLVSHNWAHLEILEPQVMLLTFFVSIKLVHLDFV